MTFSTLGCMRVRMGFGNNPIKKINTTSGTNVTISRRLTSRRFGRHVRSRHAERDTLNHPEHVRGGQDDPY